MKLLTALLLCAVVVVVSACRESTSPIVGTGDLFVGTGTIIGQAAECSSWFIQADSGALYELTSLDSEFRQIALRVRFTLRERNDLASVCMRGPKVDVVSISRL